MRRAHACQCRRGQNRREVSPDRKSTRLNSSHSQISYAVFCLKKKTTHAQQNHSVPHRSQTRRKMKKPTPKKMWTACAPQRYMKARLRVTAGLTRTKKVETRPR